MSSSLKLITLSLFAVTAACKSTSDGAALKDVENISSMNRVGSAFEVACDDGSSERVSADDIRANRVCAGQILLHRAFRQYPGGKTSFLYASDPNHPAQAGYTYEGPALRTIARSDFPAKQKTLSYCHRIDGVLFPTTTGNCEGIANASGQGIIGYVYSQQEPHTVPLYRCTRSTGSVSTATSVMMTPNQAECGQSQMQVEQVIGYIKG